MYSFRLFPVLVFPLLLFLPSCGGDSADTPADMEATEADQALSLVPEAQALYDEALEILATDRPGAIALLREAAELDPEFLAAISTAAYQLAWHYQYTDRADSIREDAFRFAQMAETLDPDHEWTIAPMGAYYYRIEKDYDRAMEYYERGMELYPENLHFLRMSAHVARRLGEWDRALAILEEAEAIAPSSDALQAIIENHRYNRRWDQMMAAAQEYSERYPESQIGPSFLAWGQFYQTANTQAIREYHATRPATALAQNRWTVEMMDGDYAAALAVMDASDTEVFSDQYGINPRSGYRGISLRLLGREAEAQEALTEAMELVEGMLPELDNDPRVHAALGGIHAQLGNRDEAVAAAQRAVELVPPERDALTGPYNVLALATVYSILGEAEAAIDQIEFLLSIPSSVTQASLEARGVWDNIREHPRFQALLEG